MKQLIFLLSIFLLLGVSSFCFYPTEKDPANLITYVLNPEKQQLRFFSIDDNGNPFVNHQGLKNWLEEKGQRLIFAVNGGMYNKDLSPQGLYIEDGKTLRPVDYQQEGYGNFYLQPNGIFYLTKNNKPVICTSIDFIESDTLLYATQSGPMLLIEGAIHPKFKKGSSNLHIRNGVGVLPNGDLLFAMSKAKINFYDLATYFKSQGCSNALYLDGFVSRTYLPSKSWEQLDGKYGIIIGEVK